MTDTEKGLHDLTSTVDEDAIDAHDLLAAIEADDGTRYSADEVTAAIEGLAQGRITDEEFDELFVSGQSVAAYVDWDHPIDVAPLLRT